MTDIWPVAEGGMRLAHQPRPVAREPLATVVTVARNSRPTLARTIQSVLAQTYPHVEYVIVDGGSTDGTVDLLRDLETQIDYWRSEADRGISDAFNKGIALARGEVIALLNGDDWYEPETVAAAMASMAKTGADIVYGALQYWDGDRRSYLVLGDAGYLDTGMTVGHPSVFVKRSCYERVGAYRLDFRYAMDYEWLLRARGEGARFAFSEACVANMQGGGIGDRRWFLSQWEVARARGLHVAGASSPGRMAAFLLVRLGAGATRRLFDRVGLSAVRRFYHRRFSPVTVRPPRQGGN